MVPEDKSSGSITTKRLRKRDRNPEIEVAFGARIRAARAAARMSQAALGTAIGVACQQIQKYEIGKDRIAASTLQDIAHALGVHPGSFFDREMTVPTGNIPEVKATMRIAERIQRTRNPVVIKRLLALVDLLAEMDGASVERFKVTGDETS